jgi:2-polyprenyl-3-methyl-5-hydroxy-6-metoxy-1,4-benzoquinol methylase
MDMGGGPSRGIARRAFKPFYIVYYRFLYGRRFPFAAQAERWVRAWEHATGRGDAPVSKEAWEEQYRRGDWGFMRRLDELARYSVISGYLRHGTPGGSVLDIGCGEGILRDELRVQGYSRYVGVDISETAIEQARATSDDTPDDKATFVAANAETWVPEGRFDAVVLNECVYYFEEPIPTLQRYWEAVAPGGLLVVSTFRSRRSAVILDRLEVLLPLADQVAVTHRKGTWVVSLFRRE